MKKIIPGLLVIVALNGCWFGQEPTPSATNPASEPAAKTGPGTANFPKSDTTDQATLDSSALHSAVETLDFTKCDALKDKTRIANCLLQISDKIIASAREKMDPAGCDRLKDAKTVSGCRDGVDAVLMAEAMEKNKPDLCKSIANETNSKKCTDILTRNSQEKNATDLFDKALKENDPALCDQITIATLKEECKKSVVSKDQAVLTDKLQKAVRAAGAANSAEPCKALPDQKLIDACVKSYPEFTDAAIKKNREACQGFGDADLIQQCLQNLP